jgi:curli production assembly/transport component CsgG
VRIIILLLLLLAGCSSIPIPYTKDCKSDLVECIEDPKQVILPTFEKLMNLPPAESKPIVAVYSFTDQTGARKRRDGIADFSSAVTQGAATLLIDALKAAGNGTWFRVVERVGIDHLVRERQIVKTTREDFDETRILNPLLFAGMILEGGIIGYDSNIETGGRGARTLGIGGQTQYRRDIVIVSLRAVSTLTGEILLNVQTSKTVLSTALGYDVFKFIDLDTQLIEIEDGITQNESNTYSVRACIEAAVLALIEQGDERKYWKINYPVPEETTDEQTD